MATTAPVVSQDSTPEPTPPTPPPTPIPADPNAPSQWKHRRRMAYIALISMLVVTVFSLSPWMPLERLKTGENVISWFYFTMTSIVGAYMGLATWSAKTAK